MAMSFSRPDPSSPAQVADANFATQRRGFDQSEVRDFLRMVSAEMARMHERERFLERELEAVRSDPDMVSAQFDEETLTRLLGEETARVLSAARASAQEIREKAEQSAARMLAEANDDANRLRSEAELEASRRRADATADAEAELAMAKQQGREMVDETRAYRERVLSELSRRRELAREQIEQLVHGRDRLVQAFERARLAAVDVMSDLQPLGEPDEYVNLNPSTGPVPVMVARADLAGPERTTSNGDSNGDSNADSNGADTSTGDVEPADTTSDVAVYDGDDDLEELDGLSAQGAGADDAADDVDHDDAEGDVVVQDLDVQELHDVDPVDAELEDVALEDADAADVALEDVDADDIETEANPAEAAPGAEAETGAEAVGVGAVAQDAHDDVVVDLFARLRADTETSTARTSTESDLEDRRGDQDDVDATGADATDADASDADATDIDVDDSRDPLDAAAEHVFGVVLGDAAVADDDADTESSIDQNEAIDELLAEPPADTSDALMDDATAENAVFAARDAVLTPLIVASARRLKRVLADEQNDVLGVLRGDEPVINLDALLPWASHHSERFSVAIRDELLEAAQAGAASVAPEVRNPLRPAAGRQSVDQAAITLSQMLVDPLRDRLTRAIGEASGDNTEITKKVRAIYREWKTTYIDDVLDDVFRTAHGRGLLAAIERDDPVEWVPDPSGPVSAECHDNQLAGAVEAGQPFPTGHLCPPAQPGCRCILVPVSG